MFDTPQTRPYLIALIILLFLTTAIFDVRYFAPKFFNNALKVFQIQKQGNENSKLQEMAQNQTEATTSHELELQNQVTQIVNTKDPNKCDEVQDKTYQDVCRNNIALNSAQEKKDASYCQKVDNNLISIADCERNVIPQKALDQKDIKVCDEATTPEVRDSCKGNFWPTLAQNENNIKVCDNLAKGDARDKCYDLYFLTKEFMTGKNTDCNNFASAQAKEDCKFYIANFDKRDLESCASLKTDFFGMLCLDKNRF